jgi:hypothetical protein
MTFYEPSENIAGAARRTKQFASLREIETRECRKLGDIQERGFDVLRRIETRVRHYPGTAAGIAALSAFLLYEIYLRA